MNPVRSELRRSHNPAVFPQDFDPTDRILGFVRIGIVHLNVEPVTGRPGNVRSHDTTVHRIDHRKIPVVGSESPSGRKSLHHAVVGQFRSQNARARLPPGDVLTRMVVASGHGRELPALGQSIDIGWKFRITAVYQLHKAKPAPNLLVVAMEIVAGFRSRMVETSDNLRVFIPRQPMLKIFQTDAVGQRIKKSRRIIHIHVPLAFGTVVLGVFIPPDGDESGARGLLGPRRKIRPRFGRIFRILGMIGNAIKIIPVLFRQPKVNFRHIGRIGF